LYFAEADDMIDLVLFEKKLYTLAVAFRNIPAPLHHTRQISFIVLNLYSIIISVSDILEYVRALQQGLGRNTSPIEADAAQLRFFNNTYFHSKLRGPDGSNVASRSAPDNKKIIFRHIPGI